MKGSEIFARSIRDLKLGPVFGNPGSTELGMLRNIDDYILTLHDSISVGMADGRSQISGKPSIVNLHTLPGVANSMAFIYTAMANRSPVVITAGQQDTRHRIYDPLLGGDTLSLVSDAVKFKYELSSSSDIATAMKRAMEIALEPPAGPVFLSFPTDVLDEETSYESLNYTYETPAIVDEESVRKICDEINSSENPAIVFGYEIDTFNALKEAEEFADKLGCAVYGEPLANRAVFRSDNQRYNGDLLPASTLMNLTLNDNDLIVFIGGDYLLYPYISSPVFPGKKVIKVGFDVTHRIGTSYRMNPRTFLAHAIKHIKKKGDFSRKRDLSLASRIASEKKKMGLTYVLSKAKRIFEGYTIVDESTSATPTLRSVFGYSKNSYFTSKTGQLGWGLAAAMGIAMEKPETLFIVGDGSLMYTVQGLWTAKKYGIPLKTLVLDNGGYNILKSYGKSYYPEMEKAEFLTLDLNVADITSGFGVETREADKDLDDLQWLKDGKEPKVLVVKVNREVPKLFL